MKGSDAIFTDDEDYYEINCSSTPLWSEVGRLPLTLRCNRTDIHQLAILKRRFSLLHYQNNYNAFL